MLVVIPAIPDSFADPTNNERLLKLSELLPPIAHILLECRLGAKGPMDLSLCVSNAEIDKSLLRQYFLTNISDAQATRPETKFINWWCEQPDTENALKSAWLEYDVTSAPQTLPPPAVFLPLNASPRPFTAAGMGAAEALESMQPGATDTLDHWLACLPPTAIPTFVGSMMSRRGTALRLNIAGLSAENAWRWLTTHGSTESESRILFETIYNLAGKPILTVDIDDVIGPRVGLECRPETEQDSRAMFDILVANNLCSSEKYDAMQEWTGHLSILDKGADWPLHLVLEAMIRSDAGASVLLRQINHVKIVFDETGLTEAKVYFGLNHAVYSFDKGENQAVASDS